MGQQGLLVITITHDNGMKIADHGSIATALQTSCYFAKHYHSWERGLNEHTNGLVCQYLPTNIDFTQISDQTVQLIAAKLKNHTRKILYYRIPLEILTMHRNMVASAPRLHDESSIRSTTRILF